MEKILRFRLLAALFATLVAMTACGGDDDDPVKDEPGVTQKDWSATEDAPVEGETLSFTFTAAASWTATSSAASWCHVEPRSGSAGQHTLTVEVDKNTSGLERSVAITVKVSGYKSSVFAVVQSKGAATATGIVKMIDDYLCDYYLWNDDYKAMERDYSIPYTSDSDNFMVNTLMSMTTNTLDKKPQGNGAYHLYSFITRTPAGNTASSATRATHWVQKEMTASFGIASATIVTVSASPVEYMFCVSAVYPDSPASKAGIKRGHWISKINGSTIGSNYLSQYYALTAPSGTSTVTLVGGPSLEQSKDETYTLTTANMYENPVLSSRVIEESGHKIGYLNYFTFDAGYDDKLAEAFAAFKTAGVTDMILDLRLNGGGHVITANLIASCIAGTHAQNKKFSYYRYNAGRMRTVEATAQATGNQYDESAGKFYELFYYGQVCPNLNTQLTNYGLNLRKLYVLVSGSSASASELVINSLKGIDVDVVLIGDKTNGKNVGMEGTTFKNVDGYNYEMIPITFQSYNAKGFGDYSAGFEADYKVLDDNFSGPIGGTYYFEGYRDFGDNTEPLLAKAISLITGASNTAAVRPTRSATMPKAVVVEQPANPRKPTGAIILRDFEPTIE